MWQGITTRFWLVSRKDKHVRLQCMVPYKSTAVILLVAVVLCVMLEIFAICLSSGLNQSAFEIYSWNKWKVYFGIWMSFNVFLWWLMTLFFNNHLLEPNKDILLENKRKVSVEFPHCPGGQVCGRQPSSCRNRRPKACMRLWGVEGRGSRTETGLWLCDVNRQEATEGVAGSVRLLLLCLCAFVCALVNPQHGHNTSGGVKLACINTYSDSFVFLSAPLLHIDIKQGRPNAFPARMQKVKRC